MKNIRFKQILFLCPIVIVGIVAGIITINLFGSNKNYQPCLSDADQSDYFQKKIFHGVFSLNPELQLLNVQSRKAVTLKSLCGSKTKLAFRYFGINCKYCIQSVIKILQYIFKDDFYSDVVLLNDSYLKTYMNDLTNSNEFYLKDLNTELEESGQPYFFMISPGSKINCKVVLVPDVNDLKSTEEDIKALVKNNYYPN